MKMIILSKTLFSDLSSNALDAYPLECCGALFGELIDETKKVVKFSLRLDNKWIDTEKEKKNKRFMITASDYMKCEKIAVQKSMLLLGFYHSHPDQLPIPSETDLKYAWPFFSYPILSVKLNKVDSIKSYILNTETNTFAEEVCEINS